MDSAFAERLIVEYFQDKPGIAAVYLFGSIAKGNSRAESDVDIGVLYQSPPAPTLMAQRFAEEADLSERFARPVQHEAAVQTAKPPSAPRLHAID